LVKTYIYDDGDGVVERGLMECDFESWRSMKKEERRFEMVMIFLDVFEDPKSCGWKEEEEER
jgi:hypothetical protein